MRTPGRLLVAAALGVLPAGLGDDRERIEVEARNQATEADRLFKGGDYAGALPLYEAEGTSRAELGDTLYEAYARRAVGCCQAQLGNDDAAFAAWQKALKLDARRDDAGFVGYDWLLIGQLHLKRGRAAEALGALKQALPRLSTAIDRDHEADARLASADALLRLDRPEEATEHLARAESLARDLSDSKRLATSWLAESLVARATDAPALAAERADDARRTFESLGARGETAMALRALGEALADLDGLDSASARLAEAARVHEALGDVVAQALDLALLAAVRADAGDPAAASKAARRVVSIRHDAGDASGEIDALVALASYEDQADHRQASAATLAAAVALARAEATPAQLVRLLLLASEETRRAGDSARANALVDEAERSAALTDNAALRQIVSDARASAAKHGP